MFDAEVPLTEETPLTIGRFLCELSPVLWGGLTEASIIAPDWPPDAFALVTGLMLRTGCYVEVLSDEWPPDVLSSAVEALDPTERKKRWNGFIRSIGETWRSQWSPETEGGSNSVPSVVTNWWKLVIEHQSLPLPALTSERHQHFADGRTVRRALLQIAAAADEACRDVGFASQDGDLLAEHCRFVLSGYMTLGGDPDESNVRTSTLCHGVSAHRFRVLPKMRTPQSGLTIRNLSHNLALYQASEVIPRWNMVWNGGGDRRTTHNLLLIPWPFRVVPSDFDVQPFRSDPHPGRFSYSRSDQTNELRNLVTEVFENALSECSRIDGVVFPELSLMQGEYDAVSIVLNEISLINSHSPPFLIAGILGNKDAEPTNHVKCLFPGEIGMWKHEFEQHKHHRWCLDRPQITRYGLSAQLDPNRRWWEAFVLKNRSLQFAAHSSGLLLSVLICEDLARPEPVADLVRAIGPNLVITLLMDGPQLERRWAARYASVLADDPGSSVLTLTSLGMTQLSREWGVPEAPRKIALWRDSQTGTRELELPANAQALVITICENTEPELTADGRSDCGAATLLTLAGVHPVCLPE